MMRRHVLGIGREPVRLRRLPELLRKWPDLLHDPVRCRVHGQIARGERPYVNYMHVRYTSLQLTQRPGLVGKALLIHADPQDLRQLVVTTEEGELLNRSWPAAPGGCTPIRCGCVRRSLRPNGDANSTRSPSQSAG